MTEPSDLRFLTSEQQEMLEAVIGPYFESLWVVWEDPDEPERYRATREDWPARAGSLKGTFPELLQKIQRFERRRR